ncbi:MAG: AraC family transcriptional regulator [Oscillospiraceae bacterium]|nr:AraC family transcriptional regulator [Oscillospiraceae bacterium]
MNRVVFSGILDGVVVDRIVRDDEFSMPSMHFHPEFEIYYLLDGERYYFIEDKTYAIGRGSLVIIDAMQIHKTTALGKAAHDRFLIELAPEPFAAFFGGLCGTAPHSVFAEHTGVWMLDGEGQRVVEGLLREITLEFKEQRPHYQALVMMKIAELLLFVTRLKPRGRTAAGAPAPQMPKHIQVNGVTDYISTHYDKVKSLDEICKRFFINKSYLCRIFKEVTGSTVQEYIHICRVKKAQELLEDGGMNVTRIASALGYGTVTHFERVFRKYTETTPLKYRKKMRLIRQKVRERKDEKHLTK